MTRLCIQSIDWTTTIEAAECGGAQAKRSPELLTCLLDQWPGYDEMEQFSAHADPVFYVEAAGHNAIEARMAKGGMGGQDGSWGVTMLVVRSGLEPGIAYHLRPRNENGRYRWSVASDVMVIGH